MSVGGSGEEQNLFSLTVEEYHLFGTYRFRGRSLFKRYQEFGLIVFRRDAMRVVAIELNEIEFAASMSVSSDPLRMLHPVLPCTFPSGTSITSCTSGFVTLVSLMRVTFHAPLRKSKF